MKKLTPQNFSLFLDEDRKVIFLQYKERINSNKSKLYRLIIPLSMWNELEFEHTAVNPVDISEFYNERI